MPLSSDTDCFVPLFVQRVAEIVRRYPHHTALWVAGEQYSYARLWEASTAIAGSLTERKGQFCALIADKSFASYASILGIMLAGKGYLPIAADDPADRITTALSQISCYHVLSDEAGMDFAQRLANIQEDLNPLAISTLVAAGRSVPESDLARISGKSPCSLLYTSGSTGVPKGVITCHSAFAAYLDSALSILNPRSNDRVSQLPPLTFDFSLHDIGMAWCSGAALYAIDRNNSYGLPGFIRKHQLTFWSSVPSGWLSIERLGALKPGGFPLLRTVVMGGEQVPPSLIHRCADACPRAVFFNLYGPTEAAIAVTISRWSDRYQALDEWPLGQPLPGNQLLLIDENRQPVKSGQRGEICISGVQVAQGYVNPQQASNTSQFAMLPDQPGLWYLTGDDGIWDEQFGLLFRGRRDAQWQVRGYRVERAEIEGLIRQVADTPHVAILPVQGEDSLVSSMVAFIEGSPFPIKHIRQRCHLFLPEYLFPGHIIEMPLPRNRNMKTDYLALEAFLEEKSLYRKKEYKNNVTDC